MRGNGYATKPTNIIANQFTEDATDKSDSVQELVPPQHLVAPYHMHDKDANYLLNAKEIGKKRFTERLKSEDRGTFWNRQSKLNLPTTTTKYVGKSSSKKFQIDKKYILKITCRIGMEYVLSFELNPVPLSIAHFNGEMRKIN